MKKIIFILITFFPIVILVFFAVLINSNTILNYFPQKSDLDIFPYNDVNDGGFSEISNISIEDKKVIFNYTLENGAPYPLVGLLLQVPQNSLSISGFDQLWLNVNFSAPSLRVTLKIEIQNFTDIAKPLSFLFVEANISQKKPSNLYKIFLEDFQVPKWWYDYHHLKVDWKDKIDFSKFHSIELIDSSSPVGKPQYMELDEVSFRAQTLLNNLILLSIGLIYYLIYFLLFKPVRFYKNNLHQKKIEIAHVQTNKLDEKAKNVISFINDHYNKADLALADVAEAASVSPNRVSEILKKEFQLTFKSYLNLIRLEEAKRLLCESDRHISDIAYLLGYNNLSHFNRIFRQYLDTSPGEYRKKNTR